MADAKPSPIHGKGTVKDDGPIDLNSLPVVDTASVITENKKKPAAKTKKAAPKPKVIKKKAPRKPENEEQAAKMAAKDKRMGIDPKDITYDVKGRRVHPEFGTETFPGGTWVRRG